MSDDFISRAKLIDNVDALVVADAEVLRAEILQEIVDVPAEDAEVVRHAHWISTAVMATYDTPDGSYRFIRRTRNTCSGCGRFAAIKENYCPKCGAKMDAEESE
jgi:rRNA maturation endonuclease Nob1